ncbi:MAG: hypothetical protein AB7O98_08880 [Hyphomonadaceae bacterium]
MTKKWVDNEVYFGPDRRARGLGKRWGDRRRYDDAGQPPPLGAILRRLRVMLPHISSTDARHRALELARLAISEADRLGLPDCARALREASSLISSDAAASADRLLLEAQAAAGGV